MRMRRRWAWLGGFLLAAASAGGGEEPKVYTDWPFDAAQAKQRQQETAQALGMPVVQEVDLGGGVKLSLTLVPAGEFLMGSAQSREEIDRRWPGARPEKGPPGQLTEPEDEHPRRRVRIAQPFYVGTCEVTRAQFRRFPDETPDPVEKDKPYQTISEKVGKGWGLKNDVLGFHEGISWRNLGLKQGEDDPVMGVAWDDVVDFCAWLSRKAGGKFTLPTEAQWEFACRAGSDGIWPFSSSDREEDAQGKANIAGDGEEKEYVSRFKGVRDGYTFSSPVGKFEPNAFGLYDMIGNAWEWCWPGEDASKDPEATKDPLTRFAPVRGGSWGAPPRMARTSVRSMLQRIVGDYHTGFRVLKAIR